MPDPAKLLRDGLAALGILTEGSDEARAANPLARKLERYLSELELWNPTYGLVNAEGVELVVKHLLDSLAPLSVIASRKPATLADLGTGAGLPGIPLAICMPDARIALIDRAGKRCRFLENMLASLPLPNAEVIESDIEQAKGQYDAVTFRAFRPFERKLFKSVFGLLAPGGVAYAYKGKTDKARDELGEIAGLYAKAEIIPLKVPFLDDERCVVALEK